MSDDAIVKEFVAGRSVRAIANRRRTPLAEINAVVSRWARTALHPELREQELARALERLDEWEAVFGARAKKGDYKALMACLQIEKRRCVMIGLHAPTRAVLEVIEKVAPRQSSLDKVERALDALIEDQRRSKGTGSSDGRCTSDS